jgi:hypothetical protein
MPPALAFVGPLALLMRIPRRLGRGRQEIRPRSA